MFENRENVENSENLHAQFTVVQKSRCISLFLRGKNGIAVR